MNYEHGFHAGNPGDVLKHAALVLILRELTRRQDPIHYLETHAGGGRYELAKADGEWTQGIGRLLSKNARRKLPELLPYLDLVAPEGAAPSVYPGSPLLAREILRDTDTLELYELKPSAKAQLDRAVEPKRDSRVRTFERDGYAGLVSASPKESTHLVALIDPPFESPEEWDDIEACVKRTAVKRPGATLVLWYPVKEGPPHEGRPERLRQALEASRVRGLSVELTSRGGMILSKSKHAKVRGVLLGSGLLLVGAPHRAVAKLAAALPELGRSMARAEDGTAFDVSWKGWG